MRDQHLLASHLRSGILTKWVFILGNQANDKDSNLVMYHWSILST